MDLSNIVDLQHYAVAWIPIIMAAASLGKGIFDSVKAGKMERKADALAAQIPMEDKGIRGYLDELRTQRQYAMSGATKMMAFKRRMIEDSQKSINSNLLRSAGGSSGGLMQGLLASGNIAQRNLMGAAAQSEQQGLQLLGMEGPVISDMSDRRLSLQTYARDVANARAAARRQDANSNIMGSLGAITSMDMGGFGGGYPKTPKDPNKPKGQAV